MQVTWNWFSVLSFVNGSRSALRAHINLTSRVLMIEFAKKIHNIGVRTCTRGLTH